MFCIICRDDWAGEKPGPYVLATRTTFQTRKAAELYAAGISPSREALVIEGRFDDLFFDGDKRVEEMFGGKK